MYVLSLDMFYFSGIILKAGKPVSDSVNVLVGMDKLCPEMSFLPSKHFPTQLKIAASECLNLQWHVQNYQQLTPSSAPPTPLP